MARGLKAAAFAIACLGWSASANAAPPGAAGSARAPAPALVAPVALDAGVVPYPKGAAGEAAVILELLIDGTGHVADARVVEGAEPFAAATLAACRAWRFSPARRGDRPVAARIRMKVTFHAPRPSPPAPPPAAPKPKVAPKVKPKPRPKPPEKPEEVHVHGKRHESGSVSLSGGEVRQLPGAFGDAFRAIDALPGVTPIVSGLPFFFVRGAPPGDVGYFIDGVRVPLLYHLALGPSVIHPSLIDRVDFYPGGYPARYGRYTGGILDGETKPPATRLHAEANVRLFDAGVLAETPFDHGRGDALVAGRYSYTAALVQLFAPDTQIAYWDYQGRVGYGLTPRDRVSLFAFGSFDEIDNRDSVYDERGNVIGHGPFYALFRTEFHRVDLRWDHDVPGGKLRTALTLGIDQSLAGGGSDGNDAPGVQSETVQLRTELDRRLSPKVRVRAGADTMLYHYGLTGQSSGSGFAYPDRNDVMLGAYADAIWRVHPRIEIVPGLRADIFTSRASGIAAGLGSDSRILTGGPAVAAPSLDPRLSSRITVDPRLVLVTTFGVAHQPPAFVVPVPGADLGTLAGGLQSSIQASQGVELRLPLGFTLTTTVFLHDYFGLTDALTTCISGTSQHIDSGCLDKRVKGRSYGVELFLRRALTKRLTGWISYTLSRTTRQAPAAVVAFAPDDGLGGPGLPHLTLPAGRGEVLSQFDRTHVLNVVAAADLGKGWRAGARFTVYSGMPYSRQIQGISVPPYNSGRLPPFWRIDVRLEKRWRIFRRGYIALVLEGLNITLNKEAVGLTCDHKGTFFPFKPDTCEPQYIGPVTVPSLGVEAAY